MKTIKEIIETEKKMPNPNNELIKNLETFLLTGTTTIKAGTTHYCINSDDMNCKKNIK